MQNVNDFTLRPHMRQFLRTFGGIFQENIKFKAVFLLGLWSRYCPRSTDGLTAMDGAVFFQMKEQLQMRVMQPMVKFVVISFGILDVSRILR